MLKGAHFLRRPVSTFGIFFPNKGVVMPTQELSIAPPPNHNCLLSAIFPNFWGGQVSPCLQAMVLLLLQQGAHCTGLWNRKLGISNHTRSTTDVVKHVPGVWTYPVQSLIAFRGSLSAIYLGQVKEE